MNICLKSLGLDHLNVEERLDLIDELWESIEAERAMLPLSPAQLTELDRRLEAHLANPEDVVDWEDIKASVTERLGR